MTVKELIEQLSELDPELHVFVKGYEGGYQHVKPWKLSAIQDIYLDVNPEWWYGPHDTRDNCRQHPDSYQQVKGIVL